VSAADGGKGRGGGSAGGTDDEEVDDTGMELHGEEVDDTVLDRLHADVRTILGGYRRRSRSGRGARMMLWHRPGGSGASSGAQRRWGH
jgi:hypothetical protein